MFYFYPAESIQINLMQFGKIVVEIQYSFIDKEIVPGAIPLHSFEQVVSI